MLSFFFIGNWKTNESAWCTVCKIKHLINDERIKYLNVVNVFENASITNFQPTFANYFKIIYEQKRKLKARSQAKRCPICFCFISQLNSFHRNPIKSFLCACCRLCALNNMKIVLLLFDRFWQCKTYSFYNFN